MNAVVIIYALAVASLSSTSSSSSSSFLFAASESSSSYFLWRRLGLSISENFELSRVHITLSRGGGSDDSNVDDDDDDDDDNIASSIITTSEKTTTLKTKLSKSRKKKLASNNKIAVSQSTQITNDDNDANDDDDDDDVTAEDAPTSTVEKNTISQIMKGKDAASILGDGIRQRAHILRQDSMSPSSSLESRDMYAFDVALVSLGLSMGTAGTDRDVSCNIRKTTDKSDNNVNDNNSDDDEEEDSVRDITAQSSQAYYQYGHRIDKARERNWSKNLQQTSHSTMTTVIADYLKKTHGGTHLIQVILSLLASGLGVTCLILPPFPSSLSYQAIAPTSATLSTSTVTQLSSKILSHRILLSTLKYQLMQQTLILGMAKHASGLVGAILLGAMQIPKHGVRNVRRYLEVVASDDPVGQYLFYCSLLVVWMGWFTSSGDLMTATGRGGGMTGYIAQMRGSIISVMNAASATAAAEGSTAASSSSTISQEATVMTQLLNTLMDQPPPWFLSHFWGYFVPIIILSPVLLREIISIIWVVSDVISLITSSSNSKGVKLLLGTFLTTCRTFVDGILRVQLVMSDAEWGLADSFQRQKTTALLVSRHSSVMELAVGAILVGDVMQSFWNFALLSPTASTSARTRMPFKCVIGKMVCAHLYMNFLQSKRRKRALNSKKQDVVE